MPPVDAATAMHSSGWSAGIATGAAGWAGRCVARAATGSIGWLPSIMMRSVSTSAKRPEKLPRPGFASVSLAPSASASIAAGPPSMQFDDRISTRAFSARARMCGSASMPFIPGISMSSTTTSTGSQER